MSRQLMAINVLFAVVSVLCVAYIVRQLLLPPMPMPVGRMRAARPGALAVAAPPRPAPGAYGVVVARSVFSPTRTEATSAAIPGIASVGVKPNLYGVVLRDGGPIAYLEDPVTRRIGGYRIGDAIGGGTVQTISADNVVIMRPDGPLDVRLHDASRPRTAEAVPGQPAAGVLLPGMAPGAIAPALPNPAFTAPVPLNVPVAPMPVPGRRQLPPNLLRRAPTPGNATPQ